MTVDPLGIDWRSVEGRMEVRRRLIAAEREVERLREALRKIAELNLPYRDTANRARSIALASLDAPSIPPEASS